MASQALAVPTDLLNGAGSAQPTGSSSDPLAVQHTIQQVSNLLIFVVGAVAVITLIIGAFRYVLSGGNAAKVEAAKNTILYAIVGIVVASLAFALVQFVFARLT